MITDNNRKIIQEQYASHYKSTKINFLLDNIIITENVTELIAPYIEKLFSKKQHTYSIICDTETYKVLGQGIEKQLSDFRCKTLILSSDIIANDKNIDIISHFSTDSSILIAVGSGTINDLCKYVSHKQKKDYVIFGTAPSMNGYCSSNASITINGNKTTLKTHLPKAVFFDINILANAPQRLIASGVGDSLCRSTCQADWLFSHLIADTYYNESAFKILEDSESKLIYALNNNPHNVTNNRKLVQPLIENLILSGLAMHISKGSYPASQGEHMIAHYMEMFSQKHLNDYRTFHGEDIAVTTLYMSKLQQKTLSQNKVKLKYCSDNKDIFISRFGKEKGEYFYNEYKNKFPDTDYINYLNNHLESNWKNIKKLLQKNHIQEKTIKKYLQSISLAISFNDLKWNSKIFSGAIKNSYLTRNRITFLDIDLDTLI